MSWLLLVLSKQYMMLPEQYVVSDVISDVISGEMARF